MRKNLNLEGINQTIFVVKLAIKTKRLISPLQEIKDAVILVNGERIEAVGEQKNI